MFTDYILNGQAHGPIASALHEVGFDPGYFRPYINNKGQRCVTLRTNRKVKDNKTGKMVQEYKPYLISNLQQRGIYNPTWNATSLPRDAYIQMDRDIERAARFPMNAWADLAANNTFSGFDGMGRLTLEYEAMSDPGEAIVDMDGLADGRTDSPLVKMRSLPLPITHSDFYYSERRLAVSRNTDMPLDAVSGEAAGERIGESVEKTTLGVETGVTYGTQTARHDGSSTVYGYLTHPARITVTNLTTPTGSNPEATVADILRLRSIMAGYKFTGPYVIYTTSDWDYYLDNDYARLGGSNANMTLRDRILRINDIVAIKTNRFLTGTFRMIMVQMSRGLRAVIGMPIRVVNWPSQGGMRQNWKVMCIMVPQIRYDYNGIAPIVDAATA